METRLRLTLQRVTDRALTESARLKSRYAWESDIWARSAKGQASARRKFV